MLDGFATLLRVGVSLLRLAGLVVLLLAGSVDGAAIDERVAGVEAGVAASFKLVDLMLRDLTGSTIAFFLVAGTGVVVVLPVVVWAFTATARPQTAIRVNAKRFIVVIFCLMIIIQM